VQLCKEDDDDDEEDDEPRQGMTTRGNDFPVETGFHRREIVNKPQSEVP
jgi:hypothetical protein